MTGLKTGLLFDLPTKNQNSIRLGLDSLIPGEDSISLEDVRQLGGVVDALDAAPDFFRELERFAMRNLVPSDGVRDKRVCMRCFKAFLMKKSKDYDLDEIEVKVLVFSLGGGDVGHNGYYLDGEKVGAIDNLNSNIFAL